MNLRQILDAPGVDAKVMPGNEFMLPQVALNLMTIIILQISAV